MTPDLVDPAERAKAVLDRNWTGRYTRPAPRLYPHQWNWDSGFIAIGYARYDQRRAQRELRSLFEAQWANGMLPHVVFDPASLGSYFPEPDVWQAHLSPHYPAGTAVSGITMPPVHATAALHVLRHATDRPAALEWLRRMYPRLLALHEYLYRERDPEAEGLVYIRHPWESGLDNSPAWDLPLDSIAGLAPSNPPPYRRKDLEAGVPAWQRPSNRHYDQYVWLLHLFRRAGYDEAVLREECPFLVQDPLFNSVLCKANEDLAEIGRQLGRDTGRIEEWRRQTATALRDKLWNPSTGVFDAFDLQAGAPLSARTSSRFLPLLCGAPTREQAERLYADLESSSFCAMGSRSCFSIPSYDMNGEHFEPHNYWRGPVWINVNWMLMQGLERYGFHEKARSVRADILGLVGRAGFREYFDPFTGDGYGTGDFSWTAALFLDAAWDVPAEGIPMRVRDDAVERRTAH